MNRTLIMTLALAASLLAGCIGARDEPIESTAAPEPGAPPAGVVTTDFSAEGATGTYVCGFALALGTCTPGWSDSQIVPFGLEGDAVALVGELTWTTETPATVELTAYILSKDGDGWSWEPDTHPVVSGTSPLQVDWDLTGLAGKALALGVEPAGMGAAVVWLGPSVEQPFSFAGSLTSAAPTAETA